MLKALGGQQGSDLDVSCWLAGGQARGARRAPTDTELHTPPTAASRPLTTRRKCGSSPRWSPAPKQVRGAAMCSKSSVTVAVTVRLR
eukprot:SAG31_NODE_19826_length_590_cov_2.433809_1_plen_86_part_10